MTTPNTLGLIQRRLRTAVMAACSGIIGLAASMAEAQDSQWSVIQDYCMGCHNTEDWAGSLAMDLLDPETIPADAETWENAISRLKGGYMPPPGAERPAPAKINALVSWLENTIDEAATRPSVGNVALGRLNRREYEYAIKDLLGLEINAADLLPEDNLVHGFDTNALALQVSPAFIDQYLNAARVVAHNAIGDPRPIPVLETYGSEADMIISLPARGIGTFGVGAQSQHLPGMPFGTRGGMSVVYNFMADGEYELNIGDLALGREVPNLEFEHTIIALLDGEEFYRTQIGGDADSEGIDQEQADGVSRVNNRLKGVRFNATTGQHTVTVTFLKRSFAESDERTPVTALEGGQYRIPKVNALQVRGPLQVAGMSDSEPRKRIFVCYPRETAEERSCAGEILTNMAERAFRRPLEQDDIDPLMAFYDASRETQSFENSIKESLSAILVSPHFIYRAEVGKDDGTVILSDLELASRLSFFLWSSVPDEELLTLANKGELSRPEVLEVQIGRMLADDRSKTLVDDFAFQWLHLSKLDEINPNSGMFRYASGSFDPRPLFKQELSLFIDSVLRSDQSVVRLLDADYTYLNERLAAHYGIGGVKGSAFRQVELDSSSHRQGLLGKGAVLMATANPNRTSPVIRGAWILEKLLASPAPPPPPNVETNLDQKPGVAPQTLRERLEIHRDNPSCYNCHGVLDPLGFALENFNTVGRYEDHDRDTLTLIDASGVLPDGTEMASSEDLVRALLGRSDQFVQSITQALISYGLGRELEYSDMPTVRKIVRATEKDDYTFQSIIYNIVTSDFFRMRDSVSSVEDPVHQQQAQL